MQLYMQQELSTLLCDNPKLELAINIKQKLEKIYIHKLEEANFIIIVLEKSFYFI